MSGLDVEALLASAASDLAKENSANADRSRDGDKHTRNGSDGGSKRGGSRERDGGRHRRERSREHGRKYDDDAKLASPTGSHRHRHRSREDDRDRYRHRDDKYRHRGGSPGRGRSRSPGDDDRHYRPNGDRRRDDDARRSGNTPRRARTPTPPPTEDERDRRTVFVQQLAARLRTKELIAFFEKVGPVKEAQIVKDRVSGRSKGVGYVEFKSEETVPLAIQMTGQKLLGIPIIAQLTEAEKNRLAKTQETASSANPSSAPFHRLYVGNIHFSITESDLQNVFEPFGELEFVQLQKEDAGRSRGYGFVQFRDPNQAKEALEKMNGFDLAGRPIRVGLGNDKFTPESTASLLQRFQGDSRSSQYQGSAFSGSGGRGAHAGGQANFDRASGRDDQKGGGGASALDDTDVSGVNFSNYSRDALMRKLARTDDSTADSKASDSRKANITARPENKAAPAVNQASRCIKLSNMFDPSEEDDSANWVKELEEDVKGECESKYGHVVHISLDKHSQGDIWLKFSTVQGGENAIQGLNGRFFGGKIITASPIVDKIYGSLFAKSANL